MREHLKTQNKKTAEMQYKKRERVNMDITKIEGYREDMTADEKLELVSKYQIDMSGYIEKSVFDKTSSELAEAKRQIKSKMTQDEATEAERAANEKALKDELESLRRDKTIANYKANYLALGYDDKLASETAEAFADGKFDTVFANQKTFNETIRKVTGAEKLANNYEPAAGNNKLDYSKLIAEANANGDMALMASLIRKQQSTT